MGFEDEFRNVAFTLLRFTAFSAHAFLFGLIPVLLLVLRPAFAGLPQDEWREGRKNLSARLEGMVRACLIASPLATVLVLLLQSALVSELGTGEVSLDSLESVLGSTFGRWNALRFPLIAALAVLLVGQVGRWSLAASSEDERGPGRVWWIAWGVLGVGLLATSTMSGHSTVATPKMLAIANDVIHLMSGATWFAGVIMLAVVLPDGWVGRPAPDRVALLSPAVTRFSQVAMVSIGVVALTGTLNSFLHLQAPSDLIKEPYGITLAVKIGVFLAIVALGAINHYYVRDRLEKARAAGTSSSSQKIFRKTIAAELVVALTLMILTGFLVGQARTKKIELPTDTSGTTTTSHP